MNIKRNLTVVYMVCCLLLITVTAVAQSRPPVLVLYGNNQYITYFDTQNDLTTHLIKQGVEGQATVEFWVKKVHNKSLASHKKREGKWLYSNLKEDEKEFSLAGEKGILQLKIGNTSKAILLSKDESFWDDQWHHIAISFKASSLKLYVDGNRQAEFPFLNSSFQLGNMLFTETHDNQLNIAEYRGWSKLRTAQQIRESKLLTYFNENQNNLERLNSNGLVVAYADGNFVEKQASILPMKQINWYNMITSAINTNIPKAANVTSSIKVKGEKNLILAELRTNIDHPIYSLKDVLLQASDGDGENAAGKPIIKLRWPHISGAKSYIISRRNLSDSFSNFTYLKTHKPASNTTVSSYLNFEDGAILPNELYEYQVVAEGVAGGKPGLDNGFVFANGVVKGKIETPKHVASQNVLVTASPFQKDRKIPGNSLLFTKKSTPIMFDEVSLFEELNNQGTIEFWYRTPNVKSATNTIFKFSEMEIRMTEKEVQLYSKDSKTDNKSTLYMSASKPNDTNWHHYALTFDADGGAIFIDGGQKQPTDKENPITWHGASQASFEVSLNTVSRYFLNSSLQNPYELDELRIWKVKKSVGEIHKYWNIILGDNTLPNLEAYYRFDIGDKHNVYNQSYGTLGKYKGVSINEILLHPQPLIKQEWDTGSIDIPIVYGVYTNQEGRYRFTSLNAGRQSVQHSSTYFEYRIIPSKPNNEFIPTSRVKNIPRELIFKEPLSTDFTNNSSYDISGKIVYVVKGPEGDIEFPTIKNTGIKLDGIEVASTEENSFVRTNNQGIFTISASPEKHTISVGELKFDDLNIAIDRVSLDFKNNGYAEIKENVSIEANKGFTWSGFIKPDVDIPNAEGKSQIPEIQTVLHWGDLKLELHNNQQLRLISGEKRLLSKEIEGNSVYTFFAITRDPYNHVLGFWVNDDYQTVPYSDKKIDSKVYLGASYSTSKKMINHSLANLDILEFRDTQYTPKEIKKIKNGDILSKDMNHLQLSYSFEHKIGARAVNLVSLKNQENNYILLYKGAFFNQESSSQYIRKFDFDYVAFPSKESSDLINPINQQEYLFNLFEPVSNMNFENTTRRSFIGNITIPCDNSLGDWTGTIQRTDVLYPRYERFITINDFNKEKNLFTIHDLLPGKYRVEINNASKDVTIQSSIIDLQTGNKSYDFPYRNDLKVELVLYTVKPEELKAMESFSELKSRKINSICGNDKNIYGLEAGQSILASVSVFEEYEGGICPVEGAKIDLSGDMIFASANGKTEVNGKKSFLTLVGNPNFTGDFLRNLSVSVSHENRNTTLSKKAFITGSQRGNKDFTLKDPTVGFILYDPPGDGSSSTLARGATFSFGKSVITGTDVVTSTAVTTGSDVEVQMLTLALAAPMGVGVGTGVINTVALQKSKFRGNIHADFNYRHTDRNGTSVSLAQAIKTSSSSSITGEDADVFIGLSRVLTFGTGKTLMLDDNCQPRIDYEKTVVTADELTPFVYTRHGIEENIIPSLQVQILKRHEELFPPSQEEIDRRKLLDLTSTIDRLNIDMKSKNTDKSIADYMYQVKRWQEIIKRKTREEKLNYFQNNTISFADTTSDLETVGAGMGTSITQLDSQVSFSGGTSTTYTLTRSNESSIQNSGGSHIGGGTTINTTANIAGLSFGFKTDIKAMAVIEGNDDTQKGNSRVDSFTLTDSDVGDHFSVRIKRDKVYDTPIFFTVAGKSKCPFESGTVPREGVEIVVDNAVKYGTGEESILYHLTVRNTQVARDNTFKSYNLNINGNTNQKGAQIYVNGQQLLNGLNYPVRFPNDIHSPVGVKQEEKLTLQITRGIDAPEEISYENIDIMVLASCYSLYNDDEYEEVGVKQFDKVSLTAHFTGNCIDEIELDKPLDNWVVNNKSNNKLELKFRISEVFNNQVDDTFSVVLEYAMLGNNKPHQLIELSLKDLKDHMDTQGNISYDADFSGLPDGEYSFRIVPVCCKFNDGVPGSKKNSTRFIEGVVSTEPPLVINTNPQNGGVLLQGDITAEFNEPINPHTAVNSSFSLRGIFAGTPQDLISAEFGEVNDEVIIPHQSDFNLEENSEFTIETWVNPSSLPKRFHTVPILRKGDNYSVSLTGEGKVLINGSVLSTEILQPFNWTHVAIVYDGKKTITIYYNGVSVGSGSITNLKLNKEPIEIAKVVQGNSFIGILDELRIWKIARSPSEIVSKMDKQLIGNESNLVAYFVFNDNALKGTNGAPDEAIRDFTGNAHGTIQKGIRFVRGTNRAAPLDVGKIVKDIQFKVIISDNDTKVHLVPTFEANFVEGAQITAMVLNKRLEDPYENKIIEKSWSFIVNKNTIHWSQNNLSINQEQGKETKISSIDLNNSNGGTAVKYRFKQLPSWLTVSKRGVAIEENSYQSLAAGFVERELDFTVAPHLNPGIHSIDIYIEVFQIEENKESPIGIEAFHLEVNVTCPVPNFEDGFNVNDYYGEMMITGNLFFDQEKSLDTRDIVVAYINGEYRGQASVGADGIIALSIFGNRSELEVLSFGVWDASECMEYKHIKEKYSYGYRNSIGTINRPVRFTVGKRIAKRIVLVKGYQELSFNIRDNDSDMKLSLSSIKGLERGDEIRDVESASLIACVAKDGSFITTSEKIKFLDVRKAYLINSSSSKLMSVEGVMVPLNTNIKIEGNHKEVGIPYFPNNLRTIPIALRSLNAKTVSVGDRIKRRGYYAEYTKDGWQGNLTHLTPGLGYLYKAAKEGVLNYGGISNRATLNIGEEPIDISEDYVREAAKINWEVDRNSYLNFMYLTAKMESVDIDVNKGYTIGAFINEELRGIAKPLFIDGEYKYFIGIGGDEGEAVSFKLYDGEKVADLDNHLSFLKEKYLGNIESPYTLLHSKKLKGSVLEEKDYILEQNIYNQTKDYGTLVFQIPNDQFVEVSIYNVVGQKIQTLFSEKVKGKIKHSLKLRKDNLNLSFRSGVYFFRLETKNKMITRKMIIE